SPARSCVTASTDRQSGSRLARSERPSSPEARRLDSRAPMDPVAVSTVISAPREAIFDYLQDIPNHAEFTDHYLLDWHLTRIDSVGAGAGARFRVEVPGNRYSWADVTFAEVERPHRIVEHGRTGKANRIRTVGVYELDPVAGGATRVTFTLQTA